VAAPAFLEPIAAAPRWQKVTLGLMGLALLGAGAWFLLLAPLADAVDGLRGRHATLQVELAQAQAAARDLARLRREAAELERRIAVLRERLPSDKEMPSLFRTVTDAAFQSGLAVALFQPREGRIRDYYVEIPISLTAEGGYHELGEFFERLAGLPRVVNVAELKVTGLTKSRLSLRAEVTLATYQYRPVGSPPAPKPAPGSRP